jgi:hypothetical protein
VATPIKHADRCVCTGDEREQAGLDAFAAQHFVERFLDHAHKLVAQALFGLHGNRGLLAFG